MEVTNQLFLIDDILIIEFFNIFYLMIDRRNQFVIHFLLFTLTSLLGGLYSMLFVLNTAVVVFFFGSGYKSLVLLIVLVFAVSVDLLFQLRQLHLVILVGLS
jgi:hypothetical protein